eukprot:6479897-Amphidinium_carterae.2
MFVLCACLSHPWETGFVALFSLLKLVSFSENPQSATENYSLIAFGAWLIGTWTGQQAPQCDCGSVVDPPLQGLVERCLDTSASRVAGGTLNLVVLLTFRFCSGVLCGVGLETYQKLSSLD